jgi:hypothetical protein
MQQLGPGVLFAAAGVIAGIASRVHSQTFPVMSSRPYGFAGTLPQVRCHMPEFQAKDLDTGPHQRGRHA